MLCGFHQVYDEAIIYFVVDRGEEPKIYQFGKDKIGKWKLGERRNNESYTSEFGTGIVNLSLNNFSLKRIDKKKYQGLYQGKGQELKVSAAIYEAYEVVQENLLVRVGNKTITYYGPDYTKSWEIKTENAVLKVVIGNNTFIAVSKDEIASYSLSDGILIGRIATPPKSFENNVFLSKRMTTFIWLVGNEQEFYVATKNEHGKIRNSQNFKELTLFNNTVFSEEKNIFIIQNMSLVEGYKIY